MYVIVVWMLTLSGVRNVRVIIIWMTRTQCNPGDTMRRCVVTA